MIQATNLLADTRSTVSALIDDVRIVAATDSAARAHVVDEYQRAHAAARTSLGQSEWAEGLYAQVAVAWTLGCVFVRFCEDNDLISEPLLGGPGLRAQLALDQRAAHLHAHPADDDRHWLREVFSRLRALPATGDVLGAHNPIWLEGLTPSADGARRLREGLTRVDPETGRLRHDFTDPTWDTRFLGDLYQDLSDHAKKTFALLQTPVFVEEFILDRTLSPAIATYGLADTTLIDPTCGSGHFLLGAFDRMFSRWVDAEPGTNRRVLAQRTLDAIGGIDLNPFAANIARFRLLLAAMRAGGDSRLSEAPAYDLNIAVGDSLLHGDPPGTLPGLHVPGEEESLLSRHGYSAEEVAEVRRLLDFRWAAVVGNPPYIAVADAGLRAAYKSRFKTCSGQWTLAIPFIERFWDLARSDPDPERAGFVGLIVDNSFMKREKGKKLVEEWFPTRDLTTVIDSSRAEIPGHGTPTAILFGRSRSPVATTVRAVMGIRGESPTPSDPAQGLVWRSIVDLVDHPGAESDFVSVVDLDRTRLHGHPWSIGGGGTAELKAQLDEGRPHLRSRIAEIGRTAHTGEDEAYVMPLHALQSQGLEPRVDFVSGESVRDFQVRSDVACVFPYDDRGDVTRLGASTERHLWRLRTVLRRRINFGKTNEERGLTWSEFSMFFPNRFVRRTALTFAFKVTHNHFVLSRAPRVFSQTAPAIFFADSTGNESQLGIMATLNSSIANFWLRQVSQPYPAPEPWGERIERDAAKLELFPLPEALPIECGAALDATAARLGMGPLAQLALNESTEAEGVARATADYANEFRRLVAGQERLDWTCYGLYGLVDDSVVGEAIEEPMLQPGERAFEIALARRIAAGSEESGWFTKHRIAPLVELPVHWSPEYRSLVEKRLHLIESDINVGILERPEHKRRWEFPEVDELAARALREWLLSRLSTSRYWPEPAQMTTVARLTAEARSDQDFVQIARLFAGREDVDLAAVIGDLVKRESVAYLAAIRFTEAGLRKHDEWLRTWQLQRLEDSGSGVGPIPPPPPYVRTDFTGEGWTHRGKLDVAKERFILYPGAERESDASSVVGSAGWDHLQRARALAAWYLQARRDGRGNDHLIPLLAGLAELSPWLKQWYDDPSPEPSMDRPGSQVSALVDTELRSLGLTLQDLSTWRPPAKAGRGRPRKAAS